MLVTDAFAQPKDFVQVTLPQQVTPHMVRAIAEIGEPDRRITRSGDTLNALVAAKCGAIDPIYFSVLTALNPWLTGDGGTLSVTQALPAERQLALPACAPPPGPLARQLEVGDALSKIIPPAVTPTIKIDSIAAAGIRIESLNSALGQQSNLAMAQLPNAVFGQSQAAARATNSATLSTIRADQVGPGFVCAAGISGGSYCLPRLGGAGRGPASASPGTTPPESLPLGGPDAIVRLQLGTALDPARLSAGEFIVAPAQQPIPRAIVLKAGLSPVDAVDQIKAAAKRDRIIDTTIQRSASVGIRADIPLPASDGQEACQVATDQKSWPLPVDDLIKQRERTAELRKTLGPTNTTAATILVLDSGFDFKGRIPGFPADFFPRVKALSTGTTSGILTNPLFHDRGLNFAELDNSAATPPNYVTAGKSLRWHGLAVISAALGTRSFDGRRTVGLPQIVPASAMASSGGGAVMSGQALIHAIDYAAEQQITILNFSATMEKDPGLTSSLAGTKAKLLLIVPAGNEPVDSAQFYPAAFGGGNATGSVITVGGQEPDGSVWHQSGRSDQVVDLLAPACGVPVYTGQSDADGTTLEIAPANFAGTSFAAPIVSFVAGLLAHETLGPVEIKQRLQASARLTPSAWTTTYSGGVLDSVTAISIYEDVLRYRDANGAELRVTGKLASPDDFYRICKQDDIAADRLLKFAVVEVEDSHKVRVIVRPVSGQLLKRTDCELKDNEFDLRFAPSNGGDEIAVSHKNVIDFVRRR